MELKGALTGARYLASLKDQLAERYAARLDAPYERLASERTAGLRAVAALPPDAPVAEKLERALAAVVHLTVPPAMDEEIYEREQARIFRVLWNLESHRRCSNDVLRRLRRRGHNLSRTG
jgi:hypothetical protein